MEKLIDCNTQAVTQLLDRGYSRTVVSATNNVVHSRLRNATDAAELVNGDIPFLAQLDNSLPDSFAYGHRYHLFE